MIAVLILTVTAPLLLFCLWHSWNTVFSARRLWIKVERRAQQAGRRVAILYTTCDDFCREACETLICQDYPHCDVFVLDDSSTTGSRTIDAWIEKHNPQVRVVRRSDRCGHKAGNLNNWLDLHGDPRRYPFVLVVDADEKLPRAFVKDLLGDLREEDAFVQACHKGTAQLETFFQRVLHPQVESIWRYSVPARLIPTALGHGVLYRTDALRAVGGFPEMVSEDLALTIRFAEQGKFGRIATNAVGLEAMPRDFMAYWHRRRRWIQADANLVKRMLGTLLRSKTSLVARLDLAARECRLPVGSLSWVVLLVVSLAGVLGLQSHMQLPYTAWGFLPIVLVPTVPVLLFHDLSFGKRWAYVLSMSFVGAATTAIHLPATIAGLMDRSDFTPTGAIGRRAPSGHWYTMFESVSGMAFIVSGILCSNLVLVAMGFAIASAPVLRMTSTKASMCGAVAIFWSLIARQVFVDLNAGTVPVEHLVVLAGLTITLE